MLRRSFFCLFSCLSSEGRQLHEREFSAPHECQRLNGSTQSGPDLATIQPVLTATASGGSVKIAWGWQGFSAFLDLCELTVDRADGKNFLPLAFDTTPNHEDTTPYPATPSKWTYRAIYRVDDRQVGQWSAEVTVIVSG